MPAIGRNDPCRCGSGKRYKACCGQLAATESSRDVAATMKAALAAQQARRLDEAERLYRAALAVDPDLADALHMLGVVCYEQGNDAEAWRLILRALDVTDWRYPAYRHNFGLVLARAWRHLDAAKVAAARGRYRQLGALRSAPPRSLSPRVAVVVPSFNHAGFVEHALDSVFAQTYRNIELVIVDDGSSDGSVAVIERALRASPFPHRLIVRDNRGAAMSINDGVGLTNASFINVLNSDDAFYPQRIETMVREVPGRGAQWGFSGLAFIDDGGNPIDVLRNQRAYTLACLVGAIPLDETIGFALLKNNVAVTSGNFFFSRELYDRVGGFRDFRYTHDWDFALRAVLYEEPIFVAEPTYRYRMHAANTITESAQAPALEGQTMMADFLRSAMSNTPPRSAVAPCASIWGGEFAVTALSGGMADLVDVQTLRDLAVSLPIPTVPA